MSLEGVLSDFGVGEIFQLIGQQRKTGMLEVRSGAAAFEIRFVEGQVLRARPAETRADGAFAAFLLRTGIVSDADLAEARREQEQTLDRLEDILIRQEAAAKEDLEQVGWLLTNETIFELFLWDEGRFAFRAAEEMDERLGDRLRGAEGVLLDALRMRDEWSQVQGALPDLTGVPHLRTPDDRLARELAQVAEATHVSLDTLDRMCRLVDGRLSLRRVIDLARMGTFEGARAIAMLIDRGIVRVELPREEEPAAEEPSVGAARLEAILPYAPLLAIPLAALLLLWSGPDPTTFPIDHDSLQAARLESHAGRIRAALEAFRWAKGRYPDSLAELGAEEKTLLATVPLDGYSYDRTSGGYRLDHESGLVIQAGSDPAPEAPSIERTVESERPS